MRRPSLRLARTSVEASLPSELPAGDMMSVPCRVRTRGPGLLRSSQARPTFVASRWFDATGERLVGQGDPVALGSLFPGWSRGLRIEIEAPAEPGSYRLTVAPLIHDLAWLDDVDAANGITTRVTVGPRREGDAWPELTAMEQELAAAPAVYHPSRFWEQLAGRDARVLRTGSGDFKRTVNDHYFQWRLRSGQQPLLGAVVRGWARRPDPRVMRARAAGVPRRYAVYVAMLWEIARRKAGPWLDGLAEPALGDPVAVRHRGVTVSEDLANSALEWAAVREGLSPSEGSTVIELGAGYGRVAWLALATTPGLRYLVVDIPPALALAQRYLTSVLPTLPTFRFRHFDDPDDVAAELGKVRLAFLTPNQLAALPPLRADAFLSISSLQEMRPDQVAHFLELADRHTDGVVYLKQWQRWHNPVDDVELTRADYPIPARWRPVFDRTHPVQTAFFEALWQTRPYPRRP